MTGLIVLFLFIFVVYQFVKPKGPKLPKATAFDLYLMEQHKQSKEKAERIPEPTIVDSTPLRDDTWVDDLYLNMIVSGKYPDKDGLRKEAVQAMKITEDELDEMIEQYKIDNKKKRNK